MKREPIDAILQPINSYIKNESTAGIILFLSAIVAIIWINSPFAHSYHELWHFEFSISFAGHTISNTLHHWINDGLMSMFFFVVGLELKREIMGGELSSFKNALLPITAAIGGMVVPAVIYYLLNPESPESSGWGIPMATDIAFALGILSLLGNRVPVSLKIFLMALAIADDLGAVLVIAFFYTSDISLISLGTGAVFMAVLLLANNLGVRNTLFYGIVGIGGLWLAFLMSGVHATIAGVLAALTIPARTKIDEIVFVEKLKNYVNDFLSVEPNDVTLLEPEQMHYINKIQKLTRAADTPLQRLEHALHPFVAFIIMPLFALSNAGIAFDKSFFENIFHPVSLGIMGGLFIGKFVGVAGMCFIMIKFKWADFPPYTTWRHLVGAALLAGVGFTMSMFVTNLAFADEQLNELSKAAILLTSLCAGLIGYLVLRIKSPNS